MADQPLPPDPDSGSPASSSADLGSGPDSPSDPMESVDPMDPVETVESGEPSLGDLVATARDIVLYAPIALVLDAPTLLPKLAEQGKVHMRNAKALGPHALRRIQNRLIATAGTVGEQAGELLRQFGVTAEPSGEGTPTGTGRGSGSGEAARSDARRPGPGSASRAGRASVPAPADATGDNGRGPAPAAPPSPPVDELAIPDYDSLSALQVVDRLPGLTAGELEAVRAYEAAHRGRKTILNKAAQLQA